MSQIDIQDLVDKSRFPNGWRHVSLFLYTPVGLLLVLIRSLVALQLWLSISLLPDCNTLRVFSSHVFSFIFGITVKTDPESEIPDGESRVIIANNVSVLDHFAIYKITGALSPSTWKLPSPLSNAMGLQQMDMSSKDALVANIKQFLSTTKCKIALQPEFNTTNSRVALLKFNSWPFSIEQSVQPVAIKTWRPDFVPVRLTAMASAWWIDVFWFMFVPYTVFIIKYLKRKTNADYEVLVREVEKDIATALGIQTSSHTVADKSEFEKRCLMEKLNNRRVNRRTSPNSQIAQNVEIQRMVRQVSEVLPLVPHNVILRDLLTTRNVDITIANILEGIVTYTPEPSPSTFSPPVPIPRAHPGMIKDTGTLASSFQERKAKMIQEARERYIQKHGLKTC